MLLLNEPMAAYTTWKVGGPAACYFQPRDLSDLVDFLRSLPEQEPLLWLGMGSNLLVRDAGFKGTVIAVKGKLNDIDLRDDNRVWVGAGVPCAHVARYAARLGLIGAAFMAGIPGTVGGALAMNAGAFGGETWRLVTQVQTLDRKGELRLRQPSEFEVGYRHVKGVPGEWFVGCELQLQAGDSQAEQAEIKRLLEQRNATQPVGLPSAGSTFRNPEGDYAARLIEAAGLKGLKIGGAQVSEKHANFIINTGNATAKDIEDLINKVRQVVQETHGVMLETEVHIVGDAT